MKKERIIDIVLVVLVLIFIGAFAVMEGAFRSYTPPESDAALTDWIFRNFSKKISKITARYSRGKYQYGK